MQRTLCPSPAQAEHKTCRTPHRNQSSSEDTASPGTPAACAPTAFAACWQSVAPHMGKVLSKKLSLHMHRVLSMML